MANKRVLLINPPHPFTEVPIIPMGVAYLAGRLARLVPYPEDGIGAHLEGWGNEGLPQCESDGGSRVWRWGECPDRCMVQQQS
jgi:hypothetical protein